MDNFLNTSHQDTITSSNLLEFLKTLAWCKQGNGNLVVVTKATKHIIEALNFRDGVVKVYPQQMTVKINKSWLNQMLEKLNNETPVPVVLVMKNDCLEICYRKHNCDDFPYDAWANPTTSSNEHERFIIPASFFGSEFESIRNEVLNQAKACPPVVPQL